MNGARLLLLGLLGAFLVLGAGPGAGAEEERSPEEDPLEAEIAPRSVRATASTPRFGWGPLDAERPGDKRFERLQAAGALGRALAITRPLAWGDVEPRGSRGGKRLRHWDLMDRAVLLWQLSGFDPVLVLEPRCAWAESDPSRSAWARTVAEEVPEDERGLALRARGIAPPTERAWRAWQQFVHDVGERYDGDGKDDMPGLTRPVQGIQIMARADRPSDWLGSPQDYLRLLHTAQVALREATDKLELWHATIDLEALGETPFPDTRQLRARLETRLPAGPSAARVEAKRAHAFARVGLEMPDLYDVMPQRGSANLDDDIANIRWLRHLLDHAGAIDRAALADPNRSQAGKRVDIVLMGGPAAKHDPSRLSRAPRVSTEELAERSYWRTRARTRGHAQRASALRWLSRGVAYDAVRTWTRAIAAGARAVVFDPHRVPPRGATEAEREDARWGWWFGGAEGEPVTHLPAAHALKDLRAAVHGFRGVRVARVGLSGVAVVFHLPRRASHPYVAVVVRSSHEGWAEPTDAEEHRGEAVMPVPRGDHEVWRVAVDGTPADREVVEAADGMALLRVGTAPVLVRPKRKPQEAGASGAGGG